MVGLPRDDVDHILKQTAHLWSTARDKSVFLTGGTGFVGSWLLESFLAANERFGLNASITVLSRDPERFLERHSYLKAQKNLDFLEGRITDFSFPSGNFELIIHAATEQGKPTSLEFPLGPFEDNVIGTKRVLEFARHARSSRVLITSSGAVYGVQPPSQSHIAEDDALSPSTGDPLSAYGQSKRISEFMGTAYASAYGFELLMARLFAFIGPRLPLDLNFAAGNFIRDAMQSEAINVSGDGTTIRSYLYAADMAIWLWTILFQGTSGRPYNVGSSEPISIKDLADLVSGSFEPQPEVKLGQAAIPGRLPARYVPSTQRACNELGLEECIPVDEGIRRTVKWCTQSQRD
jgi:nucleoside-diphosphate-sugar epimerase